LRLELAQEVVSQFNYSTAEQVLDDYRSSRLVISGRLVGADLGRGAGAFEIFV
jgi:hypothetical protein